MDLTAAIPMVRDVHGMPTVRESGEPLMALRPSKRISLAPQYVRLGLPSASNELFARESVCRALSLAASLLPEGLCLLILDGLRPLQLQREIRDRAVRDLSQEGREAELELYVASVPKTERDYKTATPPHCTGGAIDVTLADVDRAPLDLGAGFDEFNPRAWLRHYETTVSEDPLNQSALVRDRRRTLFNAMTYAGFVGYEFEYWHYELGTVRAAARQGLHRASFGPATPWSEEN